MKLSSLFKNIYPALKGEVCSSFMIIYSKQVSVSQNKIEFYGDERNEMNEIVAHTLYNYRKLYNYG